MNRPTTAKEALIAEALGDMAALIERLETLAPELQASRQALLLSHKELVNEVAIFKAQMTEVIGFAKVQTARHIGQSADDATKKLIAIQTESMQSAGRELFRAEIHPIARQVAQQLQALAERQSRHVATIWTYAGAAIGVPRCPWHQLPFGHGCYVPDHETQNFGSGGIFGGTSNFR